MKHVTSPVVCYQGLKAAGDVRKAFRFTARLHFHHIRGYAAVQSFRSSAGRIKALLLLLLLLGLAQPFQDCAYADTTAPALSGVTASTIGIFSATITWTSNEPSTTQVEYGRTTSYGYRNYHNKTLVTWHQSSLTGLAHDTLYHFRVWSRDKDFNWTISNDFTFRTKKTTPNAPTNLSATALSAFQVVLKWSDNSNIEDGFSIEQSLNGSTFTQVATVGPNIKTYTASNLQAATTYYFRVRGYTNGGYSKFTNTANVKTLSVGPSIPNPPGALTSNPISCVQINLGWNDGSTNEDGFKIEQSPDGATFTQIATTGPNANSYPVMNLNGGTRYYYRVRAFNSGGNSSYSNNTSCTTPLEAPPAPENLTAFAASDSQVNLSWSDSGNTEEGLKVERSTDGNAYTQIAALGANSVSYQDNGLQSATTYYYRVGAYNAGGQSAYSNVANVSTNLSAPSAPSGLSATAVSSSRIDVSWSDTSNNEAGFKIERSTDGTSFTEIGTAAANATSYWSTGLQNSTKYYYRTRAYNNGGDSAYTNVDDATTSASQPLGPAKAFPGAVGFGTQTPGGRGGAILKVTNLNDSGSGSLRAAISASGPRTVIFEISGTIYLQGELKIRNPFITIAGQTAPSPGITIAASELNVNTHDVLVQHIRVRVGDRLPSSITDIGGVDGISADGTGSYNVVFDHVSVSWGIDENATSWYANVHDVTFSNCIISEALYNSIHPKGIHSMGLLITPNGRNVAVVGNLMAHNMERNPLISNGASVVVANNVFYNWNGGRATNIGNAPAEYPAAHNTLVSVVGNSYIAGINTPSTSNAISTTSTLNSGSQIYHSDNRLERISGMFRNMASFNPVVTNAPIWLSGWTASSSANVETLVLQRAGARPADRDAVDQRIVNEVRTRTGRLIDSQVQVGGFPNLPVNTRTINVPSNANSDDDNDGYTNFEETVLFPMAAQVEGL